MSDIKIYVIYSNQKPALDTNSVLEYLFSPHQNYSELWAQREICNQHGREDEMVGFFHFRRYLDFSYKPIHEPAFNYKYLRPYKFAKWPNCSQYSEKYTHQLEADFDILAPLPEWTGVCVRERYQQYPNHRISDLDEVTRIIKEITPDYFDYVQQYLKGEYEYYGNMYIMRRKLLHDYFDWLFLILRNFDNRVQDQLPRTPGYLAERLFGIWLLKQKSEGKLRIGYLPRIHFYGFDDSTHHFRRDCFISIFLPPATRRRFYVKKMKRFLTG